MVFFQSKRLTYLLAAALVLSGMILSILGMRKTIRVIDDNQDVEIVTFALRVDHLLSEMGILLWDGDQVSPPLSHWLQDGDVITIRHAIPVVIQADGKTHQTSSVERLPTNLLALAGLAIFPGDQVIVNGLQVEPDLPLPRLGLYSLQVRRAVPVSVHLKGQPVGMNPRDPAQRDTYPVASSTATLARALWEAGISLYAGDRLIPEPETPVTSALEASLFPSREIIIQFTSGEYLIHSTATTVGEAINDVGFSLQGLDYSTPALDAPLPQDRQVRITRVKEIILVEQEPIPFNTQFQPAANLELDSRGIVQVGTPGIQATRVRVRFEDEQEISRLTESEYIALEPQSQILGYGTKVVIRTMNTPSGPIDYWRAIPMYATSYSPCRIFEDRCDSGTASGAILQKGIAAMTNPWYRYYGGSRVYVPGYGIATIADTGGGIPGRHWIDLGYSDSDYVSWHQTVTVYFLTPVPSEIMWILE